MGPVFAFCETAMNCTFINFSIEAEMPRRRGPATLLRSGVEGSEDGRLLLTPRAPSTAAEGAVWLEVTYGGEIADDLVADVGPSLEYFLGRRPVLVADLAGSEDVAAAPPSLDVFDASEQLGGSGALFVDAAHLRSDKERARAAKLKKSTRLN